MALKGSPVGRKCASVVNTSTTQRGFVILRGHFPPLDTVPPDVTGAERGVVADPTLDPHPLWDRVRGESCQTPCPSTPLTRYPQSGGSEPQNPEGPPSPGPTYRSYLHLIGSLPLPRGLLWGSVRGSPTRCHVGHPTPVGTSPRPLHSSGPQGVCVLEPWERPRTVPTG